MIFLIGCDKCIPCYHVIAGPPVADREEGQQICRITAEVLNGLSRTNDKGWSSSWGFGGVVNNYSPPELDILGNISQSLTRSVMIPYSDVINGKCTSDVARGT